MDGNKDESEKCILLAEKYINDGQREKATKYLHKAEKLYPSQRAKDLLELMSKLNGASPMGDHGAKQNGDVNNVRKRNLSASGDGHHDASDRSATDGGKHEYTADQIEAVKMIKKCKDYYEILSVTKEAGDSELKKQYRKLALQFHPDKNKAPGATEAFKAIGNAFAVLSDPEKRKRYDLYGAEEEQRSRSTQRRNNYYEYDYTRGFEAEMTAEELFNMFFGGGFNSGNVYVRRGNRFGRYREPPAQTSEPREQTSYSAILQLLPIILLIALSLTSSFFVSEPPYSLQQTQKYSVERSTQNLHIPYFVKDAFLTEYKNNVWKVEQQVEDDYVNGLRQACFREMNYKESLLWRARSFGDNDLMKKANSMKMPSCDSLRNLQDRLRS